MAGWETKFTWRRGCVWMAHGWPHASADIQPLTQVKSEDQYHCVTRTHVHY